MIEVDYGGGGHRTRLRDQEINCCVYGVPPSSVYKGGGGEGRPRGWRALGGGNLLQVGLAPFPNPSRRRGKEEGERKERGAPPPLLVQFRLEGEGARSLPWPPLIFSTKAH